MVQPAQQLPATPAQLPDPLRAQATPGPRRVRARRAARLAGALTLTIGFVTALEGATGVMQVDALVALAASWALAFAVGALVYLASLLVQPRLPAELAARQLGPGSASEKRALILPLVAAGLVAPLSLHGVVAALLGCGPMTFTFNQWMVGSVIVVGHAHLVLIAMLAVNARKLSEDRGAVSPWPTLWWTTVTAATPGVLAYGIPPILTALTGALLIPALYAWARRTLAAERALLQA